MMFVMAMLVTANLGVGYRISEGRCRLHFIDVVMNSIRKGSQQTAQRAKSEQCIFKFQGSLNFKKFCESLYASFQSIEKSKTPKRQNFVPRMSSKLSVYSIAKVYQTVPRV